MICPVPRVGPWTVVLLESLATMPSITPIRPIAVVVAGKVHHGTYAVLPDAVVVSSRFGVHRRLCDRPTRATALATLFMIALDAVNAASELPL